MLCSVRNLSVRYNEQDKDVVRQVNLSINDGGTTALIGESGSGKTTLALAMMGLLDPRNGATVSGSMVFQDEPVTLDSKGLSPLRGRHIGFIFQEPLLALNPLFTMGAQLMQVLTWHHIPQPKIKAKSWLERVGLLPVDRIYKLYPHQLSGGMRQRAMIALALAAGPELIIADEPTSGIDAVLRQDIMDLLAHLTDEHSGLLLITHDLAVAANYSQHIHVMQSGVIVESGETDRIIREPRHDYTRLLVDYYIKSVASLSN